MDRCLQIFPNKSQIAFTLKSCIQKYPIIINRFNNNNLSSFNYSTSKQTKIENSNTKASSKDIYIYLKPYYTNSYSKNILIYSFILTCLSKGLATSVRNTYIYYNLHTYRVHFFLKKD